MAAAARRRLPDPRVRTILSWLAALALIVIVAFVVALPGTDDGGSAASASPGPIATPVPIAFGTALDPATGEAIGLTDRFAPGDVFAYSVPPTAATAAEVHVEVLREGSSGLEPVQTPAPQQILGEVGLIAFEVPADNLIAEFGEGVFRMRIYTDLEGEPIAEGRFRLVALPGDPSTAP